jgi:hypothetical protein
LSGKKNKEDVRLLASQAGTAVSFYGILAGLTFTTSVLIFSFHTSLLWGDVFLTLTLITTILFIYSATLSYDASDHLVKDRIQKAKKELDHAEIFGTTGFLVVLIEINFIAFCVGWQYGIVVVTATILGFIYFLK